MITPAGSAAAAVGRALCGAPDEAEGDGDGEEPWQALSNATAHRPTNRREMRIQHPTAPVPRAATLRSIGTGNSLGELRAPGGIRTHTAGGLSSAPLPLGYG